MTEYLRFFLLFVMGLGFVYLVLWQINFKKDEPVFGLTFSQIYAEGLGLDWREVYSAILSELNPRKVRLIAYWQNLEPQKDKFNFADLDWQIKEAQKKNAEIVLVLGYRVPRWPECHAPNWTKSLKKEEFDEELLSYLKELILHYRSFSSIKVWQVENEPLLSFFGDCPKAEREFLKKEIETVKALDSRPVMITDSGELSLWLRTMGLSEFLGTTLYRVVWNKYAGWSESVYPPVFYTIRSGIAKRIFKNKEVIISELQAEPWTAYRKPLTEVDFEEQIKHFSVKNLKNNIEFAEKTGLREIYLWGVEWWYWRKLRGDENFWNFGKETFRQ